MIKLHSDLTACYIDDDDVAWLRWMDWMDGRYRNHRSSRDGPG